MLNRIGARVFLFDQCSQPFILESMSDLRETKRDLHGNRAYGDDYWKESIARPKVEYDYRERDNRDEDRHRGRGGGDDWWRDERFDASEEE